jgi:XTP/dITP diphosphohydrolase
MKKLLIATSNPAKLAEIREILADIPIMCVSLSDLGINHVVDETGSTFEENAIKKAREYAELCRLPTLADDGGLEIDALGGAPGVHSHRWVHEDQDSTDEELIAHTMEKMRGIPGAKRGAQLRLVLALVLPDREEALTSEGMIRGIIAEKPSTYRREGFPYRSLLYLPEIGKFYNHDELTAGEHDAYNHRKQALDKLKPKIREYFFLDSV